MGLNFDENNAVRWVFKNRRHFVGSAFDEYIFQWNMISYLVHHSINCWLLNVSTANESTAV